MQYSLDLEQDTVDPLYREYSKFRERAGVHIINAAGGSRDSLYRYEDVAAAFKDARFGAAQASPGLRRALRWTGFGYVADIIESGLLIALNPPDHTRLRKIIEPFFRGKNIDGLKLRVEKIVHELFDRIQNTGRFDLIADLAILLPTRVIAELI